MSTLTANDVLAVPQPDANGEFASPLDGALWMALTWSIPQTPLNGKAPFLSEWPQKTSVDPEQLRAWHDEFKCNFGSVALPGGIFIFEADTAPNGVPSVRERFEKKDGKFTSQLMIASRPDRTRGHRYYLWVDGIENIGQNATIYGDFSVRADGEQCVSPGSIHPDTGKQYRVISSGVLKPPTAEELAFWQSEKKVGNKQRENVASDDPVIPKGQRNSTITSRLGKIHHAAGGASYETLLAAAKDINQYCEIPLHDSELETIANSVSKYPVKVDTFAEKMQLRAQQGKQAQEEAALQEPEIEDCQLIKRPVFPSWVMRGTSLYENLVAPAVANSSKHAELIWMPAVQLFLNSIATRVHLQGRITFTPNLFLGVISPYGKFFKSSSCELAQSYFQVMDLADKYSPNLKNVQEKVIISSSGSSEGFGLSMKGLNARHAILYYPELAKFISKAGIEHSSFADDILNLYEAEDYGNLIKSAKQSFQFSAGSYCFGWCWCTTDRKFPGLWARLSNADSGLNDRMFFLLSPETPREAGLYQEPNLLGAAHTQGLIHQAIAQAVFDYEDRRLVDKVVRGMNPRSIGLVEKFALYFAMDTGSNVIDADHVERAKALADYEDQVQKYLDPIEAETVLGRVQQEMTRELRFNGGKMTYRDFSRNLHAERKGTEQWKVAVRGLIENGTIAIRDAKYDKGNLAKGSHRMVYLLKQVD
jgi:hypothetical protein